jgi:GNAT superfamily N-acetyltransferase
VADALIMIRLGTPADLGAVTGVYRSASLSNPGDRDHLLAHPEYLVLEPAGLDEGRTYVAEADGALVGFATWADAGDAIELEDLFVDPGWKRRGIATALVHRVADVLRSQGVDALEVTASPDALEFYHAVGFTDVGVEQTAFGTAPHLRLSLA